MIADYPGLCDYPQFILYIVRPRPGKPGKTDKFPINPATGRACDPTDPSAWMSLATAQQHIAAGKGEGIGFVFTEQDPFFFLDIDGAYADGKWSESSASFCSMFPGCFVEVSHSGTGLHVIGSAPLHPPHGTRYNELGLELYTKGRFVALTGTGATGTAATDATAALGQLIGMYFPPTAVVEQADWSDGPDDEWSGPTADTALIKKMRASTPSAASAFEGKATVAELLDGSTEAFLGNHSQADQALCNHLAFWTGKDCERMDRIFRESGLMRDKWDENRGPRGTYGVITILNAVAHCENVYSDGKVTLPPVDAVNEPAPPPPTEGVIREDYQFLSISAQIDHFDGCVYLDGPNEVWCPDGQIRDNKRFKVYRGGYNMALDSIGDKTTKDAWEAFTLSQGYNFPKADAICFRPENEAGAIVIEEGFKLLNTYFPITTRRVEGDPTPFTDLLEKLLPIDRDRQIFTCYLAAIVQNPGKKFQWWPVLQGTKGNGKTAIMQCMAHAVGSRYAHLPNAASMVRDGNKFNSWMAGKLFIGMEELAAGNQREFLEEFKTTITNSRIQIEGKGTNQVMGDNRANGLICTNHKDGVPVDRDERRYAFFFTAQQSKADLLRDGMGGGYFPKLWDWLNADGFAIVNDYLRSYAVAEEFNPATLCQHGPDTSSTAEALQTAKGSIEQAIEEAISEGRIGFCGGWISGFALELLLEERRAGGKINHRRRTEILEALGYVPHPALKDGRVANAFTDPGSGRTGKCRLFIKRGHLLCNLGSPAEVVKHYEKAQTEAGTLASVAFEATGGVK